MSVGDDNLIRLFSAGKSSGEFTLVKTIKGASAFLVTRSVTDSSDQAAKMHPSRRIGPRTPSLSPLEVKTA